jgi:hypothetical protein
MSFLPGHFPAGAPSFVEKLTSLSFIQSFGGTGTSVAAPSDVHEGDFLMFINVAGEYGGAQTTRPTGFTLIQNRFGSGNAAFNVSGKIAENADAGSTLNGLTASDFTRQILGLHYRGNSKLRSFSAAQDAYYAETSGNPGGDTIGSSAGALPTIMFGMAWTSGASAILEIDGSTSGLISVNAPLKMGHRIYNIGDTAADHFVDAGDAGGDNHLLAFYLNFT